MLDNDDDGDNSKTSINKIKQLRVEVEEASLTSFI